MLLTVSDPLQRDLNVPCSDIEGTKSYFCDVLGFCLDEESTGRVRLLRDGYAVHLQPQGSDASPLEFKLLLDIKALESALAYDREAGRDDMSPPQLGEDQRYSYRTQDPSGNELELQASVYRGRRRRRPRGETRRIRPRSSNEPVPSDS